MIKSIFPIEIYEAQYENFKTIKDSVVSELLSLDLGHHDYIVESVTSVMNLESSNKILTSEVLKPVVKFVNQNLNSFWSYLQYNGSPVISHIWAQVYENKGYCLPHHHTPHSLTGCFYVNATPAHGNLRLQNPNETMLSQVPYRLRSDIEFRNPGYFDHTVEVNDGKLILFPSFIWHRSEMNRLHDSRIVIAFNIN
jgi:uncharacterized protein (TIGR02466 family)